MKYVPVRDAAAALKGATIQTRNSAQVKFEHQRYPGGGLMVMTRGERFLFGELDLEELADGLRLLAADLRADVARSRARLTYPAHL